jgi:thioesterase domain-containing protein
MAQQLRGKGEKIALLALLDTYAPGYDRYLLSHDSFRYSLYRAMQRVDLEFENLRMLARKEQVNYLLWRGKRMMRLVARRVRWKATELIPRVGQESPDRLQELQQAHLDAMERYVPKTYPGSVVLFRASKQPAGSRSDPFLGWKSLIAGQIEVVEVPGYHDSVATGPRAKFLAECLKYRLQREQERVAQADGPRMKEYASSEKL